MFLVTLLVILACASVAFANVDQAKMGAALTQKLFGHKNEFMSRNVQGEASESTLKILGDKPGMSNRLAQGVSYAENKCAKGSEFFYQSIQGGQCSQMNDANSPTKSQMFGCTPAPDDSTRWSINIIQFESTNCSGEAYQVITQYHDEKECTENADMSCGYPTTLQMKCMLGGTHSDNFPSSLMTAYYSPQDSTCDTALTVQAVPAGICLKGATDGVPNNSSTTISCQTSDKIVYHSFQNSHDCTGKSIPVPQPLQFPDCASSVRKNTGDLVFEKQNCYIAA